MTSVILAFGTFFFGVFLGSVIERIISFPKLRREMSDVIDRVDGQRD